MGDVTLAQTLDFLRFIPNNWYGLLIVTLGPLALGLAFWFYREWREEKRARQRRGPRGFRVERDVKETGSRDRSR